MCFQTHLKRLRQAVVLVWPNLSFWQEAGVEIIRPDKAPFEEAVTELIAEFRDQPEIWKWIERIRAVEAPPPGENP